MTDKIAVIVLPRFEHDVKRLQRRYRNVYKDVVPFIKSLQAGETPGDRMKGVTHIVYKVRLPNSSARRGKSGGFRALYYLKTSTKIYLLTIYSKTDQSDIPSDLIRRIVEEELD